MNDYNTLKTVIIPLLEKMGFYVWRDVDHIKIYPKESVDKFNKYKIDIKIDTPDLKNLEKRIEELIAKNCELAIQSFKDKFVKEKENA